MDYQYIKVSRDGDALTITLNDPAVMNAVSPVMLAEFASAIDFADENARVLTVTGEGKGFCAGANLTRLQGSMESAPAQYDPGALLESDINPILKKLRRLSIPWIAAVNGAAVGVGCGFALSADLVIASESAFFMFAFGRVGLAPDGGSTFLLAQAIGRPRAAEMLLLGERLSSAKALEWGLINRLTTDAALGEEAAALARQLAKGPTRSFQLARRALWQGIESSFDDALDFERLLQREAGQTSDHREGVAAFREKRLPSFTGQ